MRARRTATAPAAGRQRRPKEKVGDPGNPRPMLRFGLRAKIALFFAALLLLVNLVVLATQRKPIVEVFERNFEVRGRELTLNLAERARRHFDDGERDGLRDLVEVFLEFEDVREAAVLQRNGEVLAVAPPRDGTAEPAANAESESDFRAAIPGSDAVARLRLSNRALSDTTTRIGWTIAGIAAVAVGIGFLLVFAAASAFTRPVLLLADLARRIRGGELGARLELRRRDEVGELATAMNAMSGELAEKEGRLRTQKNALESQNKALHLQKRELATQTRSLETLIASITEGVLFLGPDRRVAIANRAAARILRIPGNRLRGRLIGEIGFAEPDAQLETILEEACSRAACNEKYHSQIRLADHLHTVTTVHEPDTDALGVLAVVQDLSKIRALEMEQKELLDQLYQQEKMAIVGLLAASLAHEINTPLGTILLHTQRVMAELEKGDQARALKSVEREVHRCREIVRRLLDFSRIADSHPTVLDLEGPVEHSISLAEAGLSDQKISIRKSIAADVPRVRADANQVEQVLMNLIWNAADAMPEGGLIEIQLRRAGEGAEILVRDSGKGIPPEHRDTVFEPFFTTKPRGRGTGLGLAICQRIVEEHRGTIEIQPGRRKGTVVRICLPGADGNHA